MSVLSQSMCLNLSLGPLSQSNSSLLIALAVQKGLQELIIYTSSICGIQKINSRPY